jgi:hypothetical protein
VESPAEQRALPFELVVRESTGVVPG